MRKICLTVVGMYLMLLHAFSQVAPTDSSGYKAKKLKLDEINLVYSYYDQTADKSEVMGGRTDYKGYGDVTDLANGLDIKFIGWDPKGRKNSLSAGPGIDYHTAASQAYVDSSGHAKNNGTRIYPTLDWSIENGKKGTEFGLGAYYSAEHNFHYHSIGLNTSLSKKNHHNGEFSVKLNGYFDRIKMIPAFRVYPRGFRQKCSRHRQRRLYHDCQRTHGGTDLCQRPGRGRKFKNRYSVEIQGYLYSFLFLRTGDQSADAG